MRIHTFLAQLGHGSRRFLEQKIREGGITVNNKPAFLGMKVDGTEDIRLDGQRLKIVLPRPRLLLYHKPKGVICSHHDPLNKGTCFDQLPILEHGKWHFIGRLDTASTGLLLLTNSGDWVQQLSHPRYGWQRRYWVKVEGMIDEEKLRTLKRGVALEDGPARILRFDQWQAGPISQGELVIEEGRKHLVRRMMQAVGAQTLKLKRLAHGPFELPEHLHPGAFLELEERELIKLDRMLHRPQTRKKS